MLYTADRISNKPLARERVVPVARVEGLKLLSRKILSLRRHLRVARFSAYSRLETRQVDALLTE